MDHGKFKAGGMGQNQIPRSSVQMQANATSKNFLRDTTGLDNDGKPDLKTEEGERILESQKLGELMIVRTNAPSEKGSYYLKFEDVSMFK